MEAFPRYERYKDSEVPWLGEVPSHWDVRRNIGLFDERKEVNKPDMDLLSVTIDRGVIKQSEMTMKKDSSNENKSKYKVVREGDLAYNKMRMWQGAIGVSDYDGIVSPAYIILNVRDKTYSKYFHYLYKTQLFIREANRYSYGLCDDMNSLRYEDFKTMYSPVPPKKNVRRIVDFLDRKTTEIDEAISKKQRLIELLKEQKAILINHAVAKGLNPDAPMRDSCVKWIGEIPAHWSTKKLKHVATFLSGGTPSKEKEDFWGGNIPWVSPKDMKHRYLFETIDHITEKAIKRTNIKFIDAESVLIVVRGMILAKKVPVALAKVPLTINQDMKAITPSANCSPEYLLFLLDGINDTLSTFLEESGHGTKTLPTEKLSNLTIPLPPREEQNNIVGYIKELDENFDRALVFSNRQIQQLMELKQVTISEAVTGKIKI